MTSRSRVLITLKDEKRFFDKALKDAITFGGLVHGTDMDYDMREAINKVAHEFPHPTPESIQNAKDHWQQYADWWAAP